MAPLKGILKNSGGQQAEAGPSKPRAAPKTGSKGSIKVAVEKPAKSQPKAKGGKDGKGVKIVKPVKEEVDSEDDNDFGDDDDELDTEDEIERAQAEAAGGEKKPLKRKRVTTAADFGSTLTSLLSESAVKPKKAKTAKPSAEAAAPILALSAKPLPPSAASDKLERRAARALKMEKQERLDRARIRNVVEGWVPAEGAGDVGSQEFERGLRKTAQRGVIKLFNAILVASKNAEAAATTLSAKAGLKPEAPKSRKEKDNILGRGGREDVLTKESFLDLVRKGGSK
ncbi:hypothetical protein VHUM_02269 [Vanrija humicola]|uniref:Rrp15p-domain-containing protein n=1 Tax=Vanrija humicola TaxID=5417 RepID=A0A7D8ZQ27_VANHU|nr:hypothetical protein VHUM_02269 [Vanrija humicola]